MKLLTILPILILVGFFSSAQSIIQPVDIVNELKRIERITNKDSYTPPIKVVAVTPRRVSSQAFAKQLNKLKGDHALNYYEVYDVTLKQYLKKMINFYADESSGDPEIFHRLIKMINVAYKQRVLKGFDAGFTARRIWTDFSFDHYFTLVFHNSSVVFKIKHYR